MTEIPTLDIIGHLRVYFSIAHQGVGVIGKLRKPSKLINGESWDMVSTGLARVPPHPA